MLSLDDYLSQQRQGGAHQSEGQFTLAARESLSKLSKYQLGQEGLWLVKLLQAGVAANCRHFSVRHKGDGLRIRFDADVGFTARQLWDALLDPSVSLEGCGRHLLVGLRALYGQHDQMAWSCSGSSGRSVLVLHGESFEEHSQEQAEGDFFELAVNRSVTTGERVSGLLGGDLKEFETLKKFCWLAPVKIEIDGQEMTEGLFSEGRILGRWEARCQEPEGPHLLGRRANQKSRPTAESEQGVTYWNPNPSRSGLYFDHRTDPHPGGGFLDLLLSMESGKGVQSQLCYVYHGALIEGPRLRLNIAEGFAFKVYAPVNDLKVDLSEFATSEHRPELLARGRKELGLMVDLFLNCLDGHLGGDGDSDPHLAGAGASLATIATFAKSKALLIGLVGLPMSLVVGGGVVTAKKMSSYHRKMERMDMKNVLKSVRRQLPYF